MLINKSPNYIVNFKSTVFFVDNSLIFSYVINFLYKLITVTNLSYVKSNYKDLKKINTYILKSFSMHWVRVSFRGKGFRLRKFKEANKLTLNFGHSHWTKLGLDISSYFFKKIKRQNYMCLIKGYHHLKVFKKYIKNIKKLNVYTKRGLRLRKQFISRRFGKISQVVSSLH